MSERKNIDKLFQERFKDFEVAPPEHVWQNIEAELREKKKRRVIPLWLQLTGIAAALILGFLIAGKLLFKDDSREDAVVESDEVQSPKKQQTLDPVDFDLSKDIKAAPDETDAVADGSSPVLEHDDAGAGSGNNLKVGEPDELAPKSKVNGTNIPENHTNVAASEKPSGKASSTKRDEHRPDFRNATDRNAVAGNAGVRNRPAQKPNADDPKVQPIPIREKNNNSDDLTFDKINEKPVASQNDKNKDLQNQDLQPTPEELTKNLDTVDIASVPNALEELSKEKEVTSEEQKINRWQITSNVAPIYFSSATNGSPLDSRFAASNKSYKPTVSYGVGAQYAVNKKLSVRTGVHSLKLEYSTNDIVFFQTPNARQIQNLKPNLQGSLIDVDHNPGELPEIASANRAGTKFEGSLNQRTGYIEVPVELSYKLLDRRFSVDVIGGFSTLFLNENEVRLQAPGMEMTIGEADNLNSLHFSGNLGLGIRYKLLKSLHANVEPVFKYQINTFSNDAGNFKPYFFGLYTGLSYRF